MFARAATEPDLLAEHTVVAAMASHERRFEYESREASAPSAARPETDDGETPVDSSTEPARDGGDVEASIAAREVKAIR